MGFVCNEHPDAGGAALKGLGFEESARKSDLPTSALNPKTRRDARPQTLEAFNRQIPDNP